MIKYINHNKTDIIILHEIYGINQFIKDICFQYHDEGYDIFCPSLFDDKAVFSYTDSQRAYDTFINTIGFDIYTQINKLIDQLKTSYQSVILIGFSIGATIAWRCSETSSCNGVLCCYGSHIRDYLTVIPKYPVLLLFAKYDSFDVISVCNQLQKRNHTKIKIMEANHGFIDSYSSYYSTSQAQLYNLYRKKFLTDCTK